MILGLDIPEQPFECDLPPRPDLSTKPRRFRVDARFKPRPPSWENSDRRYAYPMTGARDAD